MKECPRCHRLTLCNEQDLNCLSRRDSATYICEACCTDEAMIDLFNKEPGPVEVKFLAFLKAKLESP